MIRQILGTINKRVQVGYDKSTDTIFVHASSNCIQFTHDEIDCLLSVLTLCNMIPYEHACNLLSRRYIPLWEPEPPAAEIKL